MKNSLKLAIAPKRWVKKYFRNYIPKMAYLSFDDFRIFFSLRDVSGPSFDLAYGGDSSFENYEKRDKELVSKFMKDEDVFFDIGANIGHFTFYFNQKFNKLKCFMFEPHPVLSNCIHETINYNKLDNISLHELALSNENRELEFFEDTFNDGGHSLLSDQVSKRSKANSFKVQSNTLDNYFPKMNIDRIDIIKIDVQGAEFLLLEGAIDVVRKFKPKMFVELLNSNVTKFWDELEKASSCSYLLLSPYFDDVVSRESVDLVFEDNKIDKSIEYNWFFIPKEDYKPSV